MHSKTISVLVITHTYMCEYSCCQSADAPQQQSLQICGGKLIYAAKAPREQRHCLLASSDISISCLSKFSGAGSCHSSLLVSKPSPKVILVSSYSGALDSTLVTKAVVSSGPGPVDLLFDELTVTTPPASKMVPVMPLHFSVSPRKAIPHICAHKTCSTIAQLQAAKLQVHQADSRQQSSVSSDWHAGSKFLCAWAFIHLLVNSQSVVQTMEALLKNMDVDDRMPRVVKQCLAFWT